MEFRLNYGDILTLSESDIKKLLISTGFDLSKLVVISDDFDKQQKVFKQDDAKEMKLAFTQNLDHYSEEAISQFIKMSVGKRMFKGDDILECEILSAERVPGTKHVRVVLLVKEEQKQ